jgi:hypothetical protein
VWRRKSWTDDFVLVTANSAAIESVNDEPGESRGRPRIGSKAAAVVRSNAASSGMKQRTAIVARGEKERRVQVDEGEVQPYMK